MSDTGSAGRFHLEEAFGPHGVGLRVAPVFDRSRCFLPRLDALGCPVEGERARPLQTLIWYPAGNAREQDSAPMRVADYLALWASETDFARTRPTAEALEWEQALAPALGDALRAHRDASAVPGRFPLVVYAPSFSSRAWENADLCEYLASWGYVVIAAPSLGSRVRAMTMDIGGLFAQAQDIGFLVGTAQALPEVDSERIAVVGFSWGGLANVFAAQMDNRIGALVALDGSLRYWPRLAQEAGIEPARLALPLLSIAQAEWTLEDRDRFVDPEQLDGPNILNRWGGELVDMHMLGMTHRQFSSMGQRNEDYWHDSGDPDFLDRRKADYDRDDARIGYSWMCRYVRAFLDRCLRQSAEAEIFLARAPAENGAPRHLMSIERRCPRTPPATLDTLKQCVMREGLAAVLEQADTRETEEQPVLASLGSGELLHWTAELIDSGARDEAAFVLSKLVARNQLTPREWSLAGTLLARVGRLGQAKDAFSRAVRLDPYDPALRRRLTAIAADMTETR